MGCASISGKLESSEFFAIMRSAWRSSVLLFSVMANWPSGVFAGIPRIAGRAWKSYSSALQKYPVRTNAATCGTLQVVSDAFAQRLQQQDAGQGFFLDATRSLTMLGWGGTIGGVVVYQWMRYLDKLFPPAQNTVLRVFAKIGVNQAAIAPTMNGGFFGVATARNHALTTSQGRTDWLKEWHAKIRADLLPTIIESTTFWAPVHLVNFYVVPPYARTLYVNGALFSWYNSLLFAYVRATRCPERSVYLSLVGYRRVKTE